MTDKTLRSQNLVLVVDDEPDLVELVSYNLELAGYRVISADNGFDAIRLVASQSPSIVVLDVMMPEISGTEVARRLRANPKTRDVPIVMLTARATESDQVAGLATGADDYVVKPFSMRVLLARIEAALRRAPGAAGPSALRCGDVMLDLDRHEARVGDALVSLTPTEFRLLAALIQADGRVLHRDELITRGMGPGVAVTDRAIDVHIAAVRRKLGPAGDLVQTVRGVGYRITTPAGGVEAAA